MLNRVCVPHTLNKMLVKIGQILYFLVAPLPQGGDREFNVRTSDFDPLAQPQVAPVPGPLSPWVLPNPAPD